MFISGLICARHSAKYRRCYKDVSHALRMLIHTFSIQFFRTILIEQIKACLFSKTILGFLEI